MIHFFKSHFWKLEVLHFTNFFVPRANSCPMGLLFGHLGSYIEFPLDSKNRGKIGVGVTILIITSVILVYFQQMTYQNLKYSISVFFTNSPVSHFKTFQYDHLPAKS